MHFKSVCSVFIRIWIYKNFKLYYNKIKDSEKMMEDKTNKTIVRVQPPILHPKFTNIGYGNPRYNSMLICDDGNVMISCGPTLRKIDLINNQILLNKQIGNSQIFNLLENKEHVVVINYQGLISFLKKQNYQIVVQFYAHGKQIRHSSISDNYLAISCQLNHDALHQSYLQIYKISDILLPKITQQKYGKVDPIVHSRGYYYYPELIGDDLVVIWHDDPNPKGKARAQTVMNKKLPVKHKIMRGKIDEIDKEGLKDVCKIQFEGQILCASQNHTSKQIFYLHESKRLTIYSYQTEKHRQILLTVSSAPHLVQSYLQGIIYVSKSQQLTYLYADELMEVSTEQIRIQTSGLSGNFSIKPTKKLHHETDFYLFNEYGLHLYYHSNKKTYSQTCFDITNCGISLNKDASLFAVADFGGNVYIFTTEETNIFPHPISKISHGIPVRSLVWCHKSNKIIIGCVGGTLFSWDGQQFQPQFIQQYATTVNILKYHEPYVLVGTSDGFVHILDENTLDSVYQFQAHFPIHYQNEKDRQLFGSMKNYAEIWSITAFPSDKNGSFYIVTASQDQSEKVFLIDKSEEGKFNQEQLHHLVGHSLAVTSIDWKNMKGFGQLYVSCSDDKIVRFRNPLKMFEIVHELETTTIKEWHTLTYLALEPDGVRVAIGSQNGYLFIFNIVQKQLLFGEKIHLGGIEGMDWSGNKLITCSSDLCISLITF